jgi:hypothetical protein
LEKFLIMITQEILDTFIQETDGKFSVTNPINFDQHIGYYETKEVAENELKNFINDNQITFTDGSEH